MRYSDVFGSCHPAVNFLYFVLVIAFSMCLTHPVCLLLSVCGAVIYHAVLLGPRSLRKSAVWMVPMAVLAAVINPAFTHQGVTILAYLPSGNPLTLESMLYGLASAALLSATLLWFSCYNTVMTSDKFIYLFGRVIPALSLVLSMTMRFVPRFRTQLHTVAQAQKYMGRDTENGSLLRRTKNAMKVFSIMVTWSLESAIETADSMKSRGYGEKGRTAFSIYRMDDRDRGLLVWLIFCGAYVFCGVLAGGLRFRYYPSLAGAPVTPMTVSFFVVYFLLCLTPAALDLAAARPVETNREGGAPVTELLHLENYSFTYPQQRRPALSHVTLTLPEGAFMVLCGPSGCGKSTLLRQLKTVLAPHGLREGEITFCGTPLSQIPSRRQAAEIGFVQQSPENQVVTDKVWHELAFGLESLGFDTPTIRRRVAEMASFFGIQDWFYKNVTELSGGQKQLLSLASVMVMQPRVLILDEPTSQLDPIAASDFLQTLGRINRELGTTVLLTEHRLEEALPLATHAAVMDGRTAAVYRRTGGGGRPAAAGGAPDVFGHALRHADLGLGTERCPLPGDGAGGQGFLDGVAHRSPRPTPAAGGDPSLRRGGAGGGGRVVQIRGKGPGYRPGPPYECSAGGICGPAGRQRHRQIHHPAASQRGTATLPWHGAPYGSAGRPAPEPAGAVREKDRPGGSVRDLRRTAFAPGGAAAAGGADGDPLPSDGTAGPPSL